MFHSSNLCSSMIYFMFVHLFCQIQDGYINILIFILVSIFSYTLTLDFYSTFSHKYISTWYMIEVFFLINLFMLWWFITVQHISLVMKPLFCSSKLLLEIRDYVSLINYFTHDYIIHECEIILFINSLKIKYFTFRFLFLLFIYSVQCNIRFETVTK